MYTTLFVKLNDSCLTYRRVTYLLLLFALDTILEWYFQLFCGFIMEESLRSWGLSEYIQRFQGGSNFVAL